MFKKGLFIGLLLGLVIGISPVTMAQSSVCGNWVDVSVDDPDFSSFKLVCELGFMKGNSKGELRPDQNLTRVETAVILNRMFGVSKVFDPKVDDIRYVDEYFVENLGNKDYQWVFNAAYNVSNLKVSDRYIFRGYKNGTFRPFNNINFVEFAKVFLMSLDGTNQARFNSDFDFGKTPWYTDIVDLLDGYVDIDSLDKKMSRRDAIVFIADLVRQGYVDRVLTFSSDDYSFSYPAGSLNSEAGMIARTGIQRISSGEYTVSNSPVGFGVAVPASLADSVDSVMRFESCDSDLVNCQIAYFFETKEDVVYFLEVSFSGRLASIAKPLIEKIYLSYTIK